MSSNITRKSFDPKKLYDKLLFSQKRTLLDFELNELQEILRYDLDLTSKIAVGDGPLGDGFRVDIIAGLNKILIRKGVIFHKGVILELFDDVTIDLVVPNVNSTTTVYVDWWYDEIDATEDTSLKDPNIALETATREKLVLEVKVAQGTTIPSLASGHSYYYLADIERRAGDTSVVSSSITDLRIKFAQNYVISGGLTTSVGTSLSYLMEEVSGTVMGKPYNLLSDSGTLLAGETKYLYIISDGRLMSSNTLPAEPHVPISKIVAGNTVIERVEDLRFFAPAALTGGLGKEAFGGHLYLDIKAAENIDPLQPVSLAVGGLAVKANEISFDKMPVIGLSYDKMYSGKVGRVVVFGIINNSNWSFGNTPGVPVFIKNRSLSTAVPTNENYIVQQVGVVVDEKTILLRPDSRTVKNTIVPSESSLASSLKVGSTAILGGKAVAISSTPNTIALASANEVDNLPPLGVTQKRIDAGNYGTVITFGEMINSDWNWQVGQPVYLSVNSGGLVQKPYEKPVTKGMTKPYKLARLEDPANSGTFSKSKFVVPSEFKGMSEVVFEDGIVSILSEHYTRRFDQSRQIDYIDFGRDLDVGNANPADDVRVNAVFSLKDGGMSSPVILSAASPQGFRNFSAPPGSGLGQWIWVDGIIMEYGVDYYREGDVIKFTDNVNADPGVISGSFSTIFGAMSDPVRLTGPYRDPLNSNRWLCSLPTVAGQQILIFIDGILLEPGIHFVRSPDNQSIELIMKPNNGSFVGNEKLFVVYSTELFLDTGTKTPGLMSAPQVLSRIDSKTFQVPIGASKYKADELANVVVFVDGVAKSSVRVGDQNESNTGDYKISEKEYITGLPSVQVGFISDVSNSSVVTASYGIRSGGMTSPIRPIQTLNPIDPTKFYKTSDTTYILPSGTSDNIWIWQNGVPKVLGNDFNRSGDNITFIKDVGSNDIISMSKPVSNDTMTKYSKLTPALSKITNFILPENTGAFSTVSVNGKTLIDGKGYYRKSNSSVISLAESPRELSTKPKIVLIGNNSESTFNYLKDGGYIVSVVNTSATVSQLLALTYDGDPYDIFMVDRSTFDASTDTIKLKDLWQAGRHVISIGIASTNSLYPIKNTLSYNGSYASEPLIDHVTTRDLRSVTDIGAVTGSGTVITELSSEFIALYTLRDVSTKITGTIGTSSLNSYWFHDNTGGLTATDNGKTLLMNILTHMMGYDLLSMDVLAATSREFELAGSTEVYNTQMGIALSNTKMFVKVESVPFIDVDLGGMSEVMSLTRIDSSNYRLPPGAGSTEIVFVEGVQKTPGTDYFRDDDVITFNSPIPDTTPPTKVSSTTSIVGGGMTVPQVLSKVDDKYQLPKFLDSGKNIWIFSDGLFMIPERDYTILNGLLTFVTIEPNVVEYSYSVTTKDMSDLVVLTSTSDRRVYRLPNVAGDNVIVTLDNVVLESGTQYNRIPGNPTIILTFDPENVNPTVAVAYSRKSVRTDSTTKSSDSHWRGPVDSVDSLPTVGNNEGDVRLVTSVGVFYRWSDDAQTWKSTFDKVSVDNKASLSFAIPGPSVVGTKQVGVLVPYQIKPEIVMLKSDNAPTGADLIIDINKNGTTVFSDQILRPKISSGNTSASFNSIFDEDLRLLAGDLVTIDVDQVGSTIKGGDLLYITIVGEKV